MSPGELADTMQLDPMWRRAFVFMMPPGDMASKLPSVLWRFRDRQGCWSTAAFEIEKHPAAA